MTKKKETIEIFEKISIFKQSGEIKRYPWEIFGADSWLAVFSGLGLLPERYHPDVDQVPLPQVQQLLAGMRQQINGMVQAVPERIAGRLHMPDALPAVHRQVADIAAEQTEELFAQVDRIHAEVSN